MNSTDPTKTYDLRDLIYEGMNGEINISTTSFVNRIDNMVFPTNNVYDSYMDFIIPLTINLALSEEEFYKYKYRPKLLSKDLYDTVELWFLILKLNRMQSSMDFVNREIRVIDPQKIEILTRVLVFNKERLEKSHNYVKD